MPLLFRVTLFVSAALLFWVQPMMAKMVLPLLGGVPAVWNTCMVFYQILLLIGYAYVHLTTTRLSLRAQMGMHGALLLLAALLLPIRVPDPPSLSGDAAVQPVIWLWGYLLRSVGLPFFIISTSAPLLQKWFSTTRGPAAQDPYFLYGASNLGSLLALLAYPAVLEPSLLLREQNRLWAAGYALLAVLVAVCGAIVLKTGSGKGDCVTGFDSTAGPTPGEPDAQDSAPSGRRKLRWIAFAFAPSSLMLGVTTHLTTDIASIPLLWVIPLALYLLSFVLVFARRPIVPVRFVQRAVPIGVLVLTFAILSDATHPVWLLITLHLLVLFLAALMCHGRLATGRPTPRYLTEFYLCLAAGGALGGMFNALLAPLLFNTVVEYPLALVLVCWLLPPSCVRENTLTNNLRDVSFAVVMGVLVALLTAMVPLLEFKSVQVRNALTFGAPVVLAYAFVDRPHRFALTVGALMLGATFFTRMYGGTVAVSRSFFGVSHVVVESNGNFRRFVHGNTIHGRQWIDPARQCEPLAYYHRTGPIGRVFKSFNARPVTPEVAVVGLGIGELVSYSQAGQRWTFYELDPDVARIAQDTNYFTFLSHCAVGPVTVILGDARLRLRDARPGQYGLIVLDAFSSDAIPVHLLTREAVELYLSKLAPGGILTFHISNRSLALEPVLGDLAGELKLVCLAREDSELDTFQFQSGKEPSHWLVMVRRKEDLGTLGRDERWRVVAARPGKRIWTDDCSPLLGAMKWR
jgi:hypothetical protein